MPEIVLKVLPTENIEICRDLCNELMAFQKSKAILHPEAFAGMNFDTRMKRSCEAALRSHIVVAYDGEQPIGYVFSTIDEVTDEHLGYFPDWAPKGEGFLGFYPDWVKTPQKIGCLSNLYLRDGYKGQGVGGKLFASTMEWLGSFADSDLAFVYISNGNNNAYDFYTNKGFVYSHDVFGGFIKAAYYKFTK